MTAVDVLGLVLLGMAAAVGFAALTGGLLAFGDEFVEGRPGELAVLVAHDGGSRMEGAPELRLITRDHPVVVGADRLGHGRDVRLVRPLTHLARAPFKSRTATTPASSPARRRTSTSIGWVSLPVNVFCWLGWYDPTTV